MLTHSDIKVMARANALLSEVMEEVSVNVVPGITPQELDRQIERAIVARKGIPVFKGFDGFPAASCISINEAVVHGIPTARPLEEGDICSVDIGIRYRGFCGDMARTFPVGQISTEAQSLIDTTRESLDIGLAQIKRGSRLYDVSAAIQTYVEARGYGVVRDYCGHGIGKSMHMQPEVPNYGTPGTGPKIKAGFGFAVEPMVTLGDYAVEKSSDGWTVVTSDRQLAAHFEDTVIITKKGGWVVSRLGQPYCSELLPMEVAV